MDREYIIRLGVALALAAACRTGTQPSAPTAALVPPAPAGYDPARDLGPLFQDVQLSHVFPDSKTFVDARPLLAPAAVAERYAATRGSAGFSLRAFVAQYFELPRPAADTFHTDTSQTMEQHIRALWPVLTRAPPSEPADARSSLIPLPNAY